MEIGITCGVNWTTRKVCSRNDLRFRRSQRSGRLVGNPIGIGINLLCCSHGHAELEALAVGLRATRAAPVVRRRLSAVGFRGAVAIVECAQVEVTVGVLNLIRVEPLMQDRLTAPSRAIEERDLPALAI